MKRKILRVVLALAWLVMGAVIVLDREQHQATFWAAMGLSVATVLVHERKWL